MGDKCIFNQISGYLKLGCKYANRLAMAAGADVIDTDRTAESARRVSARRLLAMPSRRRFAG